MAVTVPKIVEKRPFFTWSVFVSLQSALPPEGTGYK
jgi:hypothetical protein